MIEIYTLNTVGFLEAIHGMRNPLESHNKSDSTVNEVGPEDLKLMKTLAKAGPDHGKFMRMITVYADITAPLYWWKEYDTYKIGTVANSTSTMHSIEKREFTKDMFSFEHIDDVLVERACEMAVNILNYAREKYNETKNKRYWWFMIQTLPTSFNQKRTVTLNYAALRNIYKQRKNHKLDEWQDFCKWIEDLPYSELITQ